MKFPEQDVILRENKTSFVILFQVMYSLKM